MDGFKVCKGALLRTPFRTITSTPTLLTDTSTTARIVTRRMRGLTIGEIVNDGWNTSESVTLRRNAGRAGWRIRSGGARRSQKRCVLGTR